MSKKMNSLAKRMVIMSLMITVILICTTGLYLNAFLESDEAKNIMDSGEKIIKSPEVMIAIAIILLGIISFLFVLYKKMKKDKNVARLNDEYDLVFEQISEYIGLSSLTLIEKKELTNEILSLFLEAQDNGRDVGQVIGKDYKNFIDNMISAYGVKNSFLYDLLTGMQYFIFSIIAVNSLLFIESGYRGTSYFNIKIDYSLILYFIITFFVLLPLVYRSKRKAIVSQQDNKSRFSINYILITIGTVGAFIGFIEITERLFSHIHWISVFLHDGMVIIKSPVVLIFLLFLVVIAYYSKKKMRTTDA